MLVGQREELPHCPGADFAQRLEEPFRHGGYRQREQKTTEYALE